MHSADLARRESKEEAVGRTPEEAAVVPPGLESVLSLQRAAGNASVVRMLGVEGPAPIGDAAAATEHDDAVALSLARAVAARAGVKEKAPSAPEEPELETADFDPLEGEEEEGETAQTEAEAEGEAPVAAASAAAPALARWPWSGTKTKAPAITSKTTFKAPDGSPKTRSTVAVGEQVKFKGNVKGAWSADGGQWAAVGSSKNFVWTAPDRAKAVTIKLTAGTQTATQTMTVCEPTAISGSKVGSDLTFPAGDQGAGMQLRFKYSPLNVSFGNIEVKEVSGPATNVTGYYTKESAAALWHDSGDHFTRIGRNNEDTAIDTASFTGDPPPWTDGGFEWLIPNNFRTITEAGDGKRFTTVTQAFELKGPPKAGNSRVSKAGVSTAWRMP